MTCDYVLLNAHYCLLFRRRFGIGRLDSVWLVSGYAHVFELLCIVTVSLLNVVGCSAVFAHKNIVDDRMVDFGVTGRHDDGGVVG